MTPTAADLRRLGTVTTPAPAIAKLSAAVSSLRGITTESGLMQRAPRSLTRCGFDRAWISRVHGSRWQFAGGCCTDTPFPDLPAGLHPLAMWSGELHAVRRRMAVRVRAAENPRTADPVVAEALRPTSYVVAPILIQERAVGLLHADRGERDVDEDDREMLALFAATLGHIAERVMLQERVDQLRADLHDMTGAIAGAVDRSRTAPLSLATVSTHPTAAPAIARLHGEDRLASLLTARELEVLGLMASGQTNADIAEQLVITCGTVKSHVKHILRKMQATNRSQAVARCWSISNTGEPGSLPRLDEGVRPRSGSAVTRS